MVIEFDQLGRVRLLQQQKSETVQKLLDSCKDFVQDIGQLERKNEEILQILKQKSSILENQKKEV